MIASGPSPERVHGPKARTQQFPRSILWSLAQRRGIVARPAELGKNPVALQQLIVFACLGEISDGVPHRGRFRYPPEHIDSAFS